MNIRALFTAFLFVFLFQSVKAQDTVKHIVRSEKHNSKHSADTTIVKRQAYVKDTARTHKKNFVKIPNHPRDGYIAIMGGLGVPAGVYSSSGYASTGSVFSLSAGFPGIISHCGIAFKFDYGTNSLNKDAYISALGNGIGIPNISYSFTGTPEKFSTKTILAGLYLTYPGKYITIDGRILGGVMLATYPAFAVNVFDSASGAKGTLYQSETKGSAFAIDFGIELRYHVIPKLSIILSADYVHSSPSFTDVVTGIATSNGISFQGYELGTASQAFSLFNLSLGIGYTISAQNHLYRN